MAGANNRALKAAGIPKSTIKTLRVEHGGRLNLRSALAVASERGLPVGKAHEFMTKRDAAHATSKEGQAAATDFRAKAAERLKAVAEHKARRQQNLTRAVDAALRTTLTRRLVRQHMTKLEAKQNASAAAPAVPKWTPKGRQNTPENAQRMAGMLNAGAAAIRAAGTPEKGMVHVYNPHSGKVATTKALSTKGSAVVVRDKVRQDSSAPEQYQVVHKGTGIGVGRYYSSRTDAAEVAKGLAKSLDKTIGRMQSGDARAGEALYRYSVRKYGQLAAKPTPQEKRAETRAKAKEATAAKEAEFNAKWRASNEKRTARRLAVAQRLTRMYSKAKAAVRNAGVEAYHAQLDAKKNGWEPVRAAEGRAAKAEARVKHIESRAKKLRVDPKRSYKHDYDLMY